MNTVPKMRSALSACGQVVWKAAFAVFIGAALETQVISDTEFATEGLTRDALQSIVDRNPFGLKPPPPPPVVETIQPEVKLNINITGIVRSKKGKTVHLVVQPESKTASSSPTYLSIQEGGRENGIEVLEVDPKLDKVKIRNAGVETVLSFRTHGLKSTAPPPTANPARPGGIMPPGVMPQPGQNAPNPAANGPTIISRGGVTTTSTLPNTSGGNNVGAGNYGFQNTANNNTSSAGATRAIPSRTLRTQALSGGDDSGVSGHEKAVVQVIQMEAQKLAHPNIEFPPTPGAP